jgi:mannitol/fructose-specific phosphotransferase system IIA component (Ntr-type)
LPSREPKAARGIDASGSLAPSARERYHPWFRVRIRASRVGKDRDDMRISDLVKGANVYMDLEANGREAVLTEMIGRLHDSASLGDASPEEVVKLLVERENQGSTGIGSGVALPHIKTNLVPGTVVAVGRSDEGIDFNATDAEPVHTIFLILSREGDAEEHLAVLRWFANFARSRYHSRVLRGSRTVDQITDLFREFDDEVGNSA